MNIKDALEQIMDIKAEIRELREELSDLESGCYGLSLRDLDALMAKGVIKDKTLETAVFIINTRADLTEKIKRLTQTTRYVESMLATLDARGRRLMRMYYYKGLSGDKIAVVMHYCDGHYVNKLRRRYLCRLMATERKIKYDEI